MHTHAHTVALQTYRQEDAPSGGRHQVHDCIEIDLQVGRRPQLAINRRAPGLRPRYRSDQHQSKSKLSRTHTHTEPNLTRPTPTRTQHGPFQYPPQDRILTGSAPADAECVNKDKLEAGKAKRARNKEREKESQQRREAKALAEKNRLAARTPEQVESEKKDRARKAAEKRKERKEKLALEMSKLVAGRSGAGRVREQSSASLRANFQRYDRTK